MTFGTVDAKKADFPPARLPQNCKLHTREFLIDLAVDVSIMYAQAFKEIGLLTSMFSLPIYPQINQ